MRTVKNIMAPFLALQIGVALTYYLYVMTEFVAYDPPKDYYTTTPASSDKYITTSNFFSNGTRTTTKERHNTGYVLALGYYEQMTAGSCNLQSLQCWAAEFNLSVVEPIVARSHLRSPWEKKNGFWFHDIHDIGMWNQLSLNVSHSQIVPWNDFLTSAPRSVILVDIQYKDQCKQKNITLNSHVSPFQQYKYGCTANWDPFSQFLSSHHFEVVRKVCLSYCYGDRPTLQQFNTHLYGGHSPGSTTVIYWEWRGISPTLATRVMITNSYCRIGNIHLHLMVRPCQKLLQIAVKYHQSYLHNVPYLTVMLRLEKLKGWVGKHDHQQSMNGCISKLLQVWKEVQNETGLNTTFLAGDVGKFGSDSIHKANLTDMFKNVFKMLYRAKFSIENWENSFQTLANTTDSGYISALQKVLAAWAKCILLMGGGTFQSHALNLYRQAHPRKQDQCIRVITKCSEPLYNY